MFTPQRRPSSAITLTPRSDARNIAKGKAVAFAEGPLAPPVPPPPVASLSGHATATGEISENEGMEDWRRFREAGFLDEAVMERKHREALQEKSMRLGKELFDYQYNMGLLLMEKKEWNLKLDELREALAEAEEIFKREQSAHNIAFSEAEKREDNLRKALTHEKNCVIDLEKALRDLEEEREQIKHVSELELANAKALSAGIEEKSLEVEKNLRSAEAQFSEINRKSLELDLKLKELEDRECLLDQERLSFNSKKEAHHATFYKKREDLLEWEKKLKIREEKLYELQRNLNEKEEKVNENERIREQKQRDLEEAEKKIDISTAKLREREDDVNNQLLDLDVKEKKADSMRSSLKTKERNLLSLEGELNAREKVELQKLLDEHQATLGSKMQELELELEERRKNLDEELRSTREVLGQQEVELLHREEKLRKREQALDKKSERLKEKEKDLDVRVKAAKEKEKSIKSEQKKLELEQKKLVAERVSLQNLKDACEKLGSEISSQELQIGEKSNSLKLTNSERLEHLRLVAELKQELEKCRHQEESLLKEGEDLKDEREKFEIELEVLEGKKAQLRRELNQITEEREKLEMLQSTAEERLKKEENSLKEYSRSELEDVRMAMASFEARKRSEQLALANKAKIEHDQMLKEFKSQRSTFEADMISRQEETEKGLQERERVLQLEREKELKDLNNLKEAARKELEEMRLKRCSVEMEKKEIAKNKEKLDMQQFGMRKDIDELVTLSNKLRDQRTQVIKERDRFLAFVEKHKSCKNCGDLTGEFILSDLLPPDMEDSEILLLRGKVDKLRNDQDTPGVTDVKRYGEPDSGSQKHLSWFRKCTSKIFSVSPKKVENVSTPTLTDEKTPTLAEASRSGVPGDESQPLFRTTDDSIDIQQLWSDGIKVDGDGISMSFDSCINLDGKMEDSGQSELKNTRRKPGRRNKAGLSRTRSVKAVVEDAKRFLGEGTEEPEHISNESQGIINHTDKPVINTAGKRERAPTESEQSAGISEGVSDIATTGGRRKRRQIVASAVTPGQKRYNLRRHQALTVSSEGNTSANRTLSGSAKMGVKESDGAAAEPTPNPETVSARSLGVASEMKKSTGLVKVTTVKHVEFSDDKIVRFTTEDIHDQADAKSVEITELSEEVNDTTECGVEDENGSAINDDEEDYDDDELEHPGEVSIGKKIWTFFTT